MGATFTQGPKINKAGPAAHVTYYSFKQMQFDLRACGLSVEIQTLFCMLHDSNAFIKKKRHSFKLQENFFHFFSSSNNKT